MPLDGRDAGLRTRAATCADPVARRRLLAEALEERGLAELNHRWDFRVSLRERDTRHAVSPGVVPTCGTVGCAIGVARLLWPTRVHSTRDLGPLLDLSVEEVSRTFCEPRTYNSRAHMGRVTAAAVAARLRR